MAAADSQDESPRSSTGTAASTGARRSALIDDGEIRDPGDENPFPPTRYKD